MSGCVEYEPRVGEQSTLLQWLFANVDVLSPQSVFRVDRIALYPRLMLSVDISLKEGGGQSYFLFESRRRVLSELGKYAPEVASQLRE